MKRPVVVAVLSGLAILVAACGGGDNTTQQPTVATNPTPATTTTPIPATTSATSPATTELTRSQDLMLTFDGEQCAYEGPTEGVLSEPLNLKLTNNSDVFVFGVVLWVPPDLFDEFLPTVGTDFPTTQEEESETSEVTFYSFKSNRPQFFVEVQSGSESSISAFVAAPGAYVLDCVQIEDAAMTHVWRPAAIEMSP